MQRKFDLGWAWLCILAGCLAAAGGCGNLSSGGGDEDGLSDDQESGEKSDLGDADLKTDSDPAAEKESGADGPDSAESGSEDDAAAENEAVDGADGDPGSDGDVEIDAAGVAYCPQIKSILKSCTSCHSTASPAGGVALDTYANAKSNAAASNSAIQYESMPPAGPLSTDDQALFQGWVDTGEPQGNCAADGDTDSESAEGDGPAGHTDIQNGIPHKPGKEDPKKNCVACHGADLKGGTGPNCYNCHNNSDHTVSKKGQMHKSGYGTPSNSPACNICHGPNNSGGIGRACSSCH